MDGSAETNSEKAEGELLQVLKKQRSLSRRASHESPGIALRATVSMRWPSLRPNPSGRGPGWGDHGHPIDVAILDNPVGRAADNSRIGRRFLDRFAKVDNEVKELRQ